jgi:hypothetical protein
MDLASTLGYWIGFEGNLAPGSSKTCVSLSVMRVSPRQRSGWAAAFGGVQSKQRV